MNNKELVKSGHELAKAISNDTPLIEIAKMVSNLATQLDVQTARANVLANDNAKAMLALKQADEAVKLAHSKFVGLVAENAGMKESVEHAAGCIAAAEAEGLIDALAEKDGERLADLIHRRLCHAHLPVETPATDAFLAEVRANAITDALKSLDVVFDTDCVMESNGISYEDAEQRTVGAYAVSKAL